MITHDDQLLINAYIDGELAPDERVRAEQLLVDDADARKYREELLSMSANLQALPKHYLPTEFAAEVLQAAEREMFVGTPWPTTQTESATTAGNRWARRLTYAGATIAAAILVALFIPNNVPPVAQQEADAVAKPSDEKMISSSKEPADAKLASKSERPQSGKRVDKVVESKGKKEEFDSLAKAAEKTNAEQANEVEATEGLGRFDTAGEQPGKEVLSNSLKQAGRSGGRKAATSRAQTEPLPSGPLSGAEYEFAQQAAPASRDHFRAKVSSSGKLAEKRAQVAGQFLAATYQVQVSKQSVQAIADNLRAIDDEVARKARRQLTQRGVKWTESHRGNSTGGRVAKDSGIGNGSTIVDKQMKKALGGLRSIVRDEPSSSPVVLYVEATPEQAQSLLAALDADPAFNRDTAAVDDALLTGERKRASEAPSIGGGAGAQDSALHGKYAGSDKKKAAKKDAEKSKQLAAADGIRAYRLSRTDVLDDSPTQNRPEKLASKADEQESKAEQKKSEQQASALPPAAATPGAAIAKSDFKGKAKKPTDMRQAATGQLVLVFRLREPHDVRTSTSHAAAEKAELSPPASKPIAEPAAPEPAAE